MKCPLCEKEILSGQDVMKYKNKLVHFECFEDLSGPVIKQLNKELWEAAKKEAKKSLYDYDLPVPNIKIKRYFTIRINGFYLKKNIKFVKFSDVPQYLTLNIEDVPGDLLSEDYEAMCIIKNDMLENHFLIKRNDTVDVVPINKINWPEHLY